MWKAMMAGQFLLSNYQHAKIKRRILTPSSSYRLDQSAELGLQVANWK